MMSGKFRMVVSYELAWLLEKKAYPLRIDGEDAEYVLDPNPWCAKGMLYLFDPHGEYVTTLEHHSKERPK